MELKYYKLLLMGNLMYDVSTTATDVEQLLEDLVKDDVCYLYRDGLPMKVLFTDKLIEISEHETLTEEVKRKIWRLE